MNRGQGKTTGGVGPGVGGSIANDIGCPPPYFDAFTFGSILPSTNSLPVELVRFEAEKREHEVKLNWETSSEENSDYFVVERSEDGIDFYPLSEVKSKGNSNESNSYSVIDENPYFAMNYYRLKQVDLDGASVYSEVLAVKFEMKSSIVLFPNPVVDEINIRLENDLEEEIQIEIFDQNGRLVFAHQYTDVSKHMKIRMQESNIQNSGTYFMKIHTTSATITQRFVAGY